MRLFPRFLLPLLFALALAAPGPASAQVSVSLSIRVAPPALPVYVQPAIPGPGYIWTPGYWAWGPEGYYWVPGTWVLPPRVGFLWTPGYWGWAEGIYVWHPGYWGLHVGYYGGINYGFGYIGVGYVGGYWAHGAFFYNSAVNNVHNVHITNVYVNKTVVVNNTNVTRVSYNGGEGGVRAQPTAEEQRWAHEEHIQATAPQMQHEHAAASNHALLASVNHGHPSIAASRRPGEFKGPGVVAAREEKPRGNGGPNGPHPGERGGQRMAGGPNGGPHPGHPGPQMSEAQRQKGQPHHPVEPQGGHGPEEHHD